MSASIPNIKMEVAELRKKIFPLHSRIEICGASNTGKSSVVEKLIRFRDELFEGPKIDLVLYFYLIRDSEAQKKIREMVRDVKFYQGIQKLDEIILEHEEYAKNSGVMVVLEDIQLEAFRSESVAHLFTAYAHHLPLSAVIFTCQSPYQKGAPYQALINRNLTHLILTNSPRLRSILPFLGREHDPSNPLLFLQIFNEAMSSKHEDPFPILLIDLNASDPLFQFFGGIFPGELFRVFRMNE